MSDASNPSLRLDDWDGSDRKPGHASLVPALLLAACGLLVGVVGFYAPPATGEMAVVFAPGTSERTAFYAIVQAGGRFVAPTRLDNIVIAYAGPGVAERVRAFGGLFTLAAHGLCGPDSSKESVPT